MSLMLVCPQVKKGASNLRSFLICIFSCPLKVKTKCLTYKQNYDKIVAEPVDFKYVEKHGQPDFTPPFVPRARKVRAVIEKPAKPKRVKKVKEEVKPKRKPRSDRGRNAHDKN